MHLEGVGMSAQPSLFDAADAWLPARSSDPETSRASAQRLNLREKKSQTMRACADCAVGISFTTDEVRDALRLRGVFMERGTVSSRMSQLVADGLVVKSGVATGPSGCWVTTFRLSDQGRVWLQEDRRAG